MLLCTPLLDLNPRHTGPKETTLNIVFNENSEFFYTNKGSDTNIMNL